MKINAKHSDGEKNTKLQMYSTDAYCKYIYAEMIRRQFSFAPRSNRD